MYKSGSMPEISVSDKLYSQLQTEADGEELDQALWKMVAAYRRGENPQG
jgi:hypothetical protein